MIMFARYEIAQYELVSDLTTLIIYRSSIYCSISIISQSIHCYYMLFKKLYFHESSGDIQ